MTDNHYGPDFDGVKRAYPDAVRFHYSVNAFNAKFNCWLIGTPCAYGSGGGISWKEADLSNTPKG